MQVLHNVQNTSVTHISVSLVCQYTQAKSSLRSSAGSWPGCIIRAVSLVSPPPPGSFLTKPTVTVAAAETELRRTASLDDLKFTAEQQVANGWVPRSEAAEAAAKVASGAASTSEMRPSQIHRRRRSDAPPCAQTSA